MTSQGKLGRTTDAGPTLYAAVIVGAMPSSRCKIDAGHEAINEDKLELSSKLSGSPQNFKFMALAFPSSHAINLSKAPQILADL